MAKSELVVGLDIGTTKICVVVGEVAPGGGIDIIGIGTSASTGLRKGVVVKIEQTVQSIQKALEEAELMAGCEIRTVNAGIAGSHIKGFNSLGVIAIKDGEVTPRDVERAMDAARAIAIPPDREVLHTLPQEYIVDEQHGIVDPLGMSGVRLEVHVHIVTGAVTSARDLVRSCQRAGLDVSDIVLESLASAKAVLTQEERELGVVLVDIGGGTTDIAILHNDAIRFTSTLPLGGQNLTNDIAYGLRTPMASAEEIKIKHGCALKGLVDPNAMIEVPSVGGREALTTSRHVLAEICQPRMAEILSLVDLELNRSGYRNLATAGVVLTGGTALLEGCQELGEEIFNLPTRVGFPRNIGGLHDVVNSPKYATAVGLLCYGAEKIGTPAALPSGGANLLKRIFTLMQKWFADIS